MKLRMFDCFNYVPRSTKFIFRGVTPEQYEALLQIIRFSKTSKLEENLSAMSKSEAKSLVNFKNKNGTTLLMNAVYFTNPLTVYTLLKYGADISATDNNGKNALFYVFSPQNHNQLEILRVLLNDKNCNPNEQNNSKDTVLHQAIKKNKKDVIKVLLDRNVDFEKIDMDGATPLLRAVDDQDYEIVKMLLEKNLNINYAEPKLGWTALHIASVHGNLKIIKLLVLKGSDVKKLDLQLKTPLVYARENYCVEATHFLSKICEECKPAQFKTFLSVP